MKTTRTRIAIILCLFALMLSGSSTRSANGNSSSVGQKNQQGTTSQTQTQDNTKVQDQTKTQLQLHTCQDDEFCDQERLRIRNQLCEDIPLCYKEQLREQMKTLGTQRTEEKNRINHLYGMIPDFLSHNITVEQHTETKTLTKTYTNELMSNITDFIENFDPDEIDDIDRLVDEFVEDMVVILTSYFEELELYVDPTKIEGRQIFTEMYEDYFIEYLSETLTNILLEEYINTATQATNQYHLSLAQKTLIQARIHTYLRECTYDECDKLMERIRLKTQDMQQDQTYPTSTRNRLISYLYEVNDMMAQERNLLDLTHIISSVMQ